MADELALILEIASRFTEETDRDLLIFSGPITIQNCDQFIKQVSDLKAKRTNVALFLCTYGGDPHAAYRMARLLRRHYKGDIRVLIGGYCKSAGTLIALVADSLGFSEVGELGPLDTQLSRPDEVEQMASGLEVFSTLQYLTDHAFACFEQSMLNILQRSDQTISTRLASQIASKLTTGLLKPITAQLDPMRIGIARRGLEVTKVYGKQLASPKNVLVNADTLVSHLVNDYPTHAFVIDQDEAKQLFKNVTSLTPIEQEMYDKLRAPLTIPHSQKEAFIVNFSLTIAKQEKTDANRSDRDPEESRSREEGSRPSRRKANRKPASRSREAEAGSEGATQSA